MAELLIILEDRVHIDETQNRLCWKRGQIVEIMDDGEYDGKDYMRGVLKVPGLLVEEVNKKLLTEQLEPKTGIAGYSIEEFTKLQSTPTKNYEYNDKLVTLKQNLISFMEIDEIDVKGNMFKNIEITEHQPYRRRRFKIPETILNLMFPHGEIQNTITKEDFIKYYEKIIDQSHGDKEIEQTDWRIAQKLANPDTIGTFEWQT